MKFEGSIISTKTKQNWILDAHVLSLLPFNELQERAIFNGHIAFCICQELFKKSFQEKEGYQVDSTMRSP